MRKRIKQSLQVGNKVIRARARKVARISSRETKKVIKNLVDSMRHHNLVGMAAPQIGKGLRIFVSEIRKTLYRKKNFKKDKLRVFINPRIIKKSSHQVISYEGCGSVASGMLFGQVKRPSSLKIKAFDNKGGSFELSASGLLACIIQHEIDHLNGIVFLDRVTNTRTLLGREEYIKLGRKKSKK